MPAGYDAEVAELFRDLRAATALSEMDLAARLGTRADVVQSLEQGALYALPPWAETCRVVNAYGALLNLDVRPLLRRIYAQLEAGIVELQPKPMPDVPMMTPPAEPQDYSFTPSNSGAPAAPNPLDIPWPPPAQAGPPAQRNPWPNGPTAPSPQPQAPWSNAQPQQQPQHAWPNPQSQQ
ncbi:MAG: helix-turn-helix transcriptional regulator, partial [Methyloceanibacter sp.]